MLPQLPLLSSISVTLMNSATTISEPNSTRSRRSITPWVMPSKLVSRLRPGDRLDQRLGRPGAEERLDHLEPAHQEQKADRGRQHEGDDLVLGQRRDRRADREQAAGHQPAADVAGEDHAVVGVAQIVDREPEREGQHQRDADEQPGRQELAEHRLEGRDRLGHQELDRAGLALLGPQPHADRRHQEQIEPGVPVEERLEVGLAALQPGAEIEGQAAGQRQEDDDEDVGERRGEVGRQLAPPDRQDRVHPASPGLRPPGSAGGTPRPAGRARRRPR